MTIRTVSLALAILGSCVAAWGTSRQGPAAPKSHPRLTNSFKSWRVIDFETRDAAARALAERDDALPALQKALHSDSTDFRRQAQQVIDAIRARQARRHYERMLQAAKDGEVDRLVERMVLHRDQVDDKVWRAVLELAHFTTARANLEHRKQLTVPVFDFKTCPWERPPCAGSGADFRRLPRPRGRSCAGPVVGR